MAVFQKFEDIEVWKMGRVLVSSVYAQTCGESFARDWGLRDQIQRAVVSICSNIAEGYARRGNREFVNFLWIAKGSAAEVQSQLYHALDLNYISQDSFENLYNQANLISVKLYHLIKNLSAPEGKGISYQKI